MKIKELYVYKFYFLFFKMYFLVDTSVKKEERNIFGRLG